MAGVRQCLGEYGLECFSVPRSPMLALPMFPSARRSARMRAHGAQWGSLKCDGNRWWHEDHRSAAWLEMDVTVLCNLGLRGVDLPWRSDNGMVAAAGLPAGDGIAGPLDSRRL